MPGVQHLIDFVLNEVALCGNQGVYSLFTGTHFSCIWIFNVTGIM